ncbi:LysE/ArgO family amino acid transporter [Bacillus chungangensis]|uniref:L-lysine exporter family protein LysE/ArgO n=1 Tax=Bacillus chungangensis TaxID=587633 RepID=A0ABT9WY40_9BACI|nr:LysE/ArgO family amino acid transporter [Bacillus chungangensis]MDQ0178039.1 L-lysine exporter family protein LysE/ArgO [Bacillus chungangensis]
MLEPILHGIILAFGLIIPLGVQNVFVFNQGATQPSLMRAMPVVLTAAICDTFLIVLAVLGVSLILLAFTWIKLLLFGIGFFFLLYMGWSIWKSEAVAIDQASEQQFSRKKQIVFALSVSLLNPHAILDTIGVIGTNSLSYTGDERWAFTITTIIVSWLWFIGLAIAGSMIRQFKLSAQWMNRINKVSAIIIWIVAFYMIWKLLFELI